jgi:hypothetical protein
MRILKSLIDQMKQLIKTHPDSKVSTEFLEFIDLLATENYKRTDNISIVYLATWHVTQ